MEVITLLDIPMAVEFDGWFCERKRPRLNLLSQLMFASEQDGKPE